MALLLLPAAGGTRLSGAAGNEFLFVWMTKDQDKLNTLIKKLFPASRSGSIDGAALYTSGSYALTVSGATVVFAANRSLLQAALDRHAQNGGIGAAQYTRETAGLPQGSLVRVFGDLSGVLSAPRAAQGRRIPWVAALRGYGASIDAGNSGLSIRFHLDTSGARLSASQLPIAGGSAAASLASSSPISTAVHDLWRRGRGERWAGCQGSARYGCSLAQLVMGLAPIMGWRNIPGPQAHAARARFVKAHRKSVQRWLTWLQLAGLITHTPQRDEEGFWWRTIIELHAAPELDAELLAERRRAARGRGRNLTAILRRARLTRAQRRARATLRRRQLKDHAERVRVRALAAQSLADASKPKFPCLNPSPPRAEIAIVLSGVFSHTRKAALLVKRNVAAADTIRLEPLREIIRVSSNGACQAR